jgi:beta-galactosidase
MTSRRAFLRSAAAASATGMALRSVPALAKAPRFAAAGDDFTLDGRPFQILAGEMHYPRIPRASWRDRLRKLKALGLNTLTTYVFWNAHETTPGHYDFSGNLDIAAYVRMAQEEGLYVNLRPGPFVCAEWDGGGLPAWLFPTPDIAARSLDPRYMGPVRGWLKRLGQELAPLLIDNGGPIILTQIENEYGAFGKDQAYLEAMRQALRAGGFSGLLYTADPAEFYANGAMPGVVGGINFGTMQPASAEFAMRAKVRPQGPYFCSELWGGWFDGFGKLHETMPTQPLLDSLQWMLERKYSISFYMLHGGTSFGFNAGANWDKKGYQPDISSYDYDALLDEAGRPTAKYNAVKALFARYLPPQAFGPMPAAEPTLSLPRFALAERAPLEQLLGKPRTAPQPQTLDAQGQPHGLMLYRHNPTAALAGELRFDDVRDFALLRSGGALQATINRLTGQTSAPIAVPAGQPLDVLVDTMGHCNYGHNIGKDQKGLIGTATLDGKPLEGWEHYPLPLDDISALRFGTAPANGPAFYRGTFEVSQPGFTFLDMRGWGKGYVWVNGVNLGRYWSAGPQQSLFVPHSLLVAGRNSVVVLDLFAEGERSLAASPRQIWDLPGQNPPA